MLVLQAAVLLSLLPWMNDYALHVDGMSQHTNGALLLMQCMCKPDWMLNTPTRSCSTSQQWTYHQCHYQNQTTKKCDQSPTLKRLPNIWAYSRFSKVWN